MGNKISSEKKSESHITMGEELCIGITALQGRRKNMEDCHVVADLELNHTLVAVFDG
jgi:hypothetical protein